MKTKRIELEGNYDYFDLRNMFDALTEVYKNLDTLNRLAPIFDEEYLIWQSRGYDRYEVQLPHCGDNIEDKFVLVEYGPHAKRVAFDDAWELLEALENEGENVWGDNRKREE